MSKLARWPWRWLTVAYLAHPEERSFLERAQTKSGGGLRVTVAVLSNPESMRFFGVRLARKGMQAVWLEVANGSRTPVRLDPLSIDPAYYTPLEAAYVNHFSVGKRLIGLYLGNSAVASSYGAAGSVVALMLWIYYSAQIFFFGAELTRQYALQFGSLRGVPGMGGEGDGKGEGKPPAWPANR